MPAAPLNLLSYLIQRYFMLHKKLLILFFLALISQINHAAITFKGHTNSVECIVYSPDGNTLASGSWDKTIKLWDAKTGTLKHILEGHSDTVTALAYSPDGKILASASDNGIIKLWDANSATLKHTLTDHSDSVTALAYSGKILASASDDQTIKLWEAAQLKKTLTGHSNFVTALVYSPDGKLFRKQVKPLPHHGLFKRSDNAFGNKLSIGLKNLISQGVMIEPRHVRFDDFVAQNTKGIPLPPANNGLAVNYGIAKIPASQKDVAPLKEIKVPQNYIFVIDISGSMEQEKRLDFVRTSIINLFNSMEERCQNGIKGNTCQQD